MSSSSDESMDNLEVMGMISQINVDVIELKRSVDLMYKRLCAVETVISDGVDFRIKMVKSQELIELQYKIDSIQRLLDEKSSDSSEH